MGVRPDLSGIRVFGSTAYYWINKQQRSEDTTLGFTNFSRARRGMFVGYDETRRAYKILPDGAIKFVVARVVVFDERTVVRRILRLCAHGTEEDSDGEHDDSGNVVYSRGEAKPGMARRLDMNVLDDAASPKHEGARHQLLVSAKSISTCLLYTSPSPRDGLLSRMPSSA